MYGICASTEGRAAQEEGGGTPLLDGSIHSTSMLPVMRCDPSSAQSQVHSTWALSALLF